VASYHGTRIHRLENDISEHQAPIFHYFIAFFKEARLKDMGMPIQSNVLHHGRIGTRESSHTLLTVYSLENQHMSPVALVQNDDIASKYKCDITEMRLGRP
jgi:hypothetical protein